MKRLRTVIVLTGILVFAATVRANGKVVRATDLGGSMWSDLAKGKLGEVIVEFRQGDELPVTFEAQGDLLETRQTSVSYVGIKRNFWLKLSQNDVVISMDGTTFKKLNEVISGSLEAGAGSATSGGVADAINIAFKAFLK